MTIISQRMEARKLGVHSCKMIKLLCDVTVIDGKLW